MTLTLYDIVYIQMVQLVSHTMFRMPSSNDFLQLIEINQLTQQHYDKIIQRKGVYARPTACSLYSVSIWSRYLIHVFLVLPISQ